LLYLTIGYINYASRITSSQLVHDESNWHDISYRLRYFVNVGCSTNSAWLSISRHIQ